MTAPPKRYELLDRIGAGGMAEVFRARVKGETLSPTVVVKRILPHLSENEDFQRMFMDEARIAAALQHPNIVRLVDLGRMDDRLFIALEYVNGVNVEQILGSAQATRRRIPFDVAFHIAIEVLKGLHHAHTRRGADGKPLGIVHRDVSPANVLVSVEGAVKVSDFGLAKATVRASKTIAGVVKGNAKFMAPEQIYGSAVDARTDVYAAGMLLFTLLAGRSPFEDLPVSEILERVIKGEMPVPSAFNEDVPPALDQIVERATKISPRLRYPSALELQRALEELARELKLHPRAKGLADFLHGLTAAQKKAGIAGAGAGAAAGATTGAPSIVARLGPLIAESVAAQGGSMVTTLGTIRMPAVLPAGSPEEKTTDRTQPEIHMPTSRALLHGNGRLLGHRQAVSAVAVAPTGLVGLSASHDQTVIVWDLVNRREMRTLPGHKAAVTAMALAPDGVTLVTGSRDKTVRVWDASSGRERLSLSGHDGWIFAVAISPDARFALSGSFDRTARLWDLASGDCLATFEGHRDSVSAVAFAPDGGTALTGSYDKTLKSWDLASLRERRTLRSVDSIRAAALSPDGATALSAGADAVVRLWDLTWGTELAAFVGHREPVVSLAFSTDGTRAASGSYDGTVRLWSIPTGEELACFETGRDPVLGIALSPDGFFTLVGSGDGSVSIWANP